MLEVNPASRKRFNVCLRTLTLSTFFLAISLFPSVVLCYVFPFDVAANSPAFCSWIWIWIWIYTSQKPINGYKRDGTGRAHQLFFLYRSPLLLKSSKASSTSAITQGQNVSIYMGLPPEFLFGNKDEEPQLHLV